MVNFILQYGLLEDKSQKPHECEWCGDNFGGRKRKYCSVACREEEVKYIKNKRKLERAKKRQEKRLLEERAKRDKRIAALDRELEKLSKENRELKCVVCDKELIGNQTLYCSDKCSALTRYDDNKRLSPSESIFTDNAKWHEGHYGKCNVEVVELTNPLEVIDLAPYTYESDYYIEQCIIEELPVARYTDGSIHGNTAHKPIDYYYGPNYTKAQGSFRRKDGIRRLINVLKQRIKQLEDGEREKPMVVNAD